MTRQLDFRYKILRNGADFGWLKVPERNTPVLRVDASQPIPRALSATFLPHEKINWLTDELAPYLLVNGTAYPLGILSAGTVTPKEADGVDTESVEAYDRCLRVRETRAETRPHFAKGSNYITVIQQLLTASGIASVISTPTEETLQSDREDWDIGASNLDIINTLLKEINYNPLWFDTAGMAILEPAALPTAANITHRLRDKRVESLLLPGISRETDIYNAPNVFVCICQNPDYPAPLSAVAENTNMQSPLSIPRRGRRIVEVEYLDNIASQAALDAYAARKRDLSMIRGETLRLTTGLLPGFGVYDVTALEYLGLFALTTERAWTMELGVGGKMKHVLERVVYNLEPE